MENILHANCFVSFLSLGFIGKQKGGPKPSFEKRFYSSSKAPVYKL